MRLVLKRIAVLPILLLTLGAWQCNPSSPYGKAVKVGLDIIDNLHTGADTVDKLRLNGTLTVDEERTFLNWDNTANDFVTGPYAQCVQQAHLAGDQTQGFVACAQTLGSTLSNSAALSAIHINNPKSQQKVSEITQAVVNLAQTAVTAIQAVKGGK